MPENSRHRGLTVTITQGSLGEEREADLVTWLHEDGARVELGLPIAELSTSKVIVQIEAPCSGRLRHLVQAGSVVTADTILAVIEDD